MMIERALFLDQIRQQFRIHNVVAILGPRQCGKTTLAMEYIKDVNSKSPAINHFDLENPAHLARLDNPWLALSNLKGLIVIDEIQRKPELFQLLRVLCDDKKLDQSYLILGSASRELIRQSSETLAGRIGYIELPPFSLAEAQDQQRLWLRGGFPKSYLAEDDNLSYMWRENYVRTFLEQDIPSLGIKILPNNLRKFWYMLAHVHGNIFNASELSKSLGVSYNTCSNYLEVLVGTFMIRHLAPWYENMKKRQVKSPKIYFKDSGILHTLLNLRTANEITLHPKVGASWEGFALEEVIRKRNKNPEECFFWSTHSGAEIDLMFMDRGKRYGFEFKYSDPPKLTKSMLIALDELDLAEIKVIYPGEEEYKLHEKITAVGLKSYIESA